MAGTLVADIRSTTPQVDPLLVGALARDLLLHYAHGRQIERITARTDGALKLLTAFRAGLLGADAP